MSRSPASKQMFQLGLSIGLSVGLSGGLSVGLSVGLRGREVVKSHSPACKQVFPHGLSGGLSGHVVVKSRSPACNRCSSLVFLLVFVEGLSRVMSRSPACKQVFQLGLSGGLRGRWS